MRIMLDAGHDGKRNRSPVFSLYYESDFTWKIQTYLKEELEKYGIEVGTTRRSQDEIMDVVVRGKKAKGYDLFISLHSNASGTESVDRPVGIFLAKDATTGIDEESEKIANLLANVVRDTMQTHDPAKTYYKLAGYDRNGNGITTDDDYYGVLYGCHSVKTAGIILEHSFHTNTRSAKWLYDDNNVRSLAVAEAKAIANYYGITAEPSTPVDTGSTVMTTIYKVVKGDVLARIAKKFSCTVEEIMALNPIIKNPNFLQVGWKLTIPTNTDKTSVDKVTTYTVKPGENLSRIASALRKTGKQITWLEIAKANGIGVPYIVQPGQVLIIP